MRPHPFEPSLAPGICLRCRGSHSESSPALVAVLSMAGQARHSDPETAKEAALRVRPGSARYRLLEAHSEHPDGLTDEEAAAVAGLSLTSEYATRCSELVRAGLLKDTSRVRTGSSGMARLVRQITPEGLDAIG